MQRSYSRAQPSPRYTSLLAEYKSMHSGSETVFAGGSLAEHLPEIKKLVAETGSKTILDYGSGKGLLHKQRNFPLKNVGQISSVADYLGIDSVSCYDPAVPEFSNFPAAQFDGVISTDALEHVPEEDMYWVVGEMFTAARKFVFANVASFPAKKTLPSGENAHATQRGPAWWTNFLREISANRPSVRYLFLVEEQRTFLPKLFGKIKVTALTGGGN
jgi:hypothetical protein